MISGVSESAETLSRTSKGLTAFIPPQFVNYSTVVIFNGGSNKPMLSWGRFVPFFAKGGGEGVNRLPKKYLQVAEIFMKQSKRNKGHTIN